MANTLTALMPKILASGVLHLREMVRMPRLVNANFANEAAQFGSTIDVQIPVAKTATQVTPSNTPPAPSNATPAIVQIALDQWYKDNFHLTDKDMHEIDTRKNFLPVQAKQSVIALANNVNQYLMAQYKGVYGYTGTAATTPFASTAADAINARKILHQQLCPREERRAVLDFSAEANALALATFADAEKTGSAMTKIEGEIGRKYGIDWYADDHVPTHTAGTITTGLIAKASTAQAAGLETIVATTAASTGACALVVGDIISINGHSQTYAVTAAATQASAASDVSISISPPLQTALVGSEAITVKASHVVNMAFHRDAFAFAMRPMAAGMIDGSLGNKIMSMQDPQTGIVLRLEVSRQYKQTVWEFDILYGAKLVRPELACRIAG